MLSISFFIECTRTLVSYWANRLCKQIT